MDARPKVYGALHDADRRGIVEGEWVSEPPRHLHVDLEFEVGSDPIRGRLGAGPTTLRAFQGWIELAAALEALMNPPDTEATAAADPRLRPPSVHRARPTGASD